jgi:hypothetical protein
VLNIQKPWSSTLHEAYACSSCPYTLELVCQAWSFFRSDGKVVVYLSIYLLCSQVCISSNYEVMCLYCLHFMQYCYILAWIMNAKHSSPVATNREILNHECRTFFTWAAEHSSPGHLIGGRNPSMNHESHQWRGGLSTFVLSLTIDSLFKIHLHAC